jgi:hypothetical protein
MGEEMSAEEIAAIRGEGGKVMFRGKRGGKAGAGEGTVEFVEEARRGWREFGGQGWGTWGGRVGEGGRLGGKERGSAGAGGKEGGNSAAVEQGLDDGARLAEKLERAGRERVKIHGRAKLEDATGEMVYDTREDVRTGEEVFVAGAAAGVFAGGFPAAGRVHMKKRVPGEGGEKGGNVGKNRGDGMAKAAFDGCGIKGKRAQPDGRKIDGGGGGNLGEGEGVASNAATEVHDLRGARGGETAGFPIRDDGAGGLFHGFGNAPDVGQAGKLGAGPTLNPAEGEGGVDVVGEVAFSQRGNLGNGGFLAGGKQGIHLLPQHFSGGRFEKFQRLDSDPGVVWSVGRR